MRGGVNTQRPEPSGRGRTVLRPSRGRRTLRLPASVGSVVVGVGFRLVDASWAGAARHSFAGVGVHEAVGSPWGQGSWGHSRTRPHRGGSCRYPAATKSDGWSRRDVVGEAAALAVAQQVVDRLEHHPAGGDLRGVAGVFAAASDDPLPHNAAAFGNRERSPISATKTAANTGPIPFTSSSRR